MRDILYPHTHPERNVLKNSLRDLFKFVKKSDDISLTVFSIEI